MQSNDKNIEWDIDLGFGQKFPGWLHLFVNSLFLVLIYREYTTLGTYTALCASYIANFSFERFVAIRTRNWNPKKEYTSRAERIGHAIGVATSPIIGPLFALAGPLVLLLVLAFALIFVALKRPLAFRTAFRYLLDHETRTRVFDNSVNELMLDFIECKDHENPVFRFWLGVCFRLRIALLFFQCLRIMICNAFFDPRDTSNSTVELHYSTLPICSDSLAAFIVMKFPSAPLLGDKVLAELASFTGTFANSIGEVDQLLVSSSDQRVKIELPKTIEQFRNNPALQICFAWIISKCSSGELSKDRFQICKGLMAEIVRSNLAIENRRRAAENRKDAADC